MKQQGPTIGNQNNATVKNVPKQDQHPVHVQQEVNQNIQAADQVFKNLANEVKDLLPGIPTEEVDWYMRRFSPYISINENKQPTVNYVQLIHFMAANFDPIYRQLEDPIQETLPELEKELAKINEDQRQ